MTIEQTKPPDEDCEDDLGGGPGEDCRGWGDLEELDEDDEDFDDDWEDEDESEMVTLVVAGGRHLQFEPLELVRCVTRTHWRNWKMDRVAATCINPGDLVLCRGRWRRVRWTTRSVELKGSVR